MGHGQDVIRFLRWDHNGLLRYNRGLARISKATVVRRTCFRTTFYGAYWVRTKIVAFIH